MHKRGKMVKKAQSLSINTIILLILGVLILVIIIAGVSIGWKEMWERIGGSQTAKSTIDAVIQSCSLQCSSQQVNEFCRTKKNVKGAEDIGIPSAQYTCDILRNILKGRSPNLDDCSLECK